jgi:ribonuclease G
MTKEMIVSSSAHETRVAILEEDQVAEIFIERERSRGVVGNLYKGRVSKVLPGMQSAFVDLGLERDGFLYVTDVIATFEEFDRLETDVDEPSGNGSRGTGPADAASKGGGPVSPGRGGGRRDRERDKGPEPKIEDLLKESQEIIVQVAKEPLGTKGARLTSHATMPGRFLVFMPTVDHVGVSRKIE